TGGRVDGRQIGIGVVDVGDGGVERAAYEREAEHLVAGDATGVVGAEGDGTVGGVLDAGGGIDTGELVGTGVAGVLGQIDLLGRRVIGHRGDRVPRDVEVAGPDGRQHAVGGVDLVELA